MKADFQQKVIEIVRKVPKGKVISYGQIALAAGFPTYARHVGKVLSDLDIFPSPGTGRVREGSLIDIPWWRVVNNQGYLSIRGNWMVTKDVQRKLLLAEGVDVDSSYKLVMKKYRYILK